VSAGALLLDLDGTLLDTPTAIVEVLCRVLGPGVDPVAVRRTVGRPLPASVAGLMGVAVDDPAVSDAVDRYRLLFSREVAPRAARLVLPGVLDTLARVRQAGWRTAVVTSKVRSSAVPLIEGAGLSRLLDAVVCDDMVAHGKPDPEMALVAAARLDTPAGRCVVIGDGVDDMRMAVEARMAAIGVTTGVGGAEDLRAAGANDVATGFAVAVGLAVRLVDRAPVPD
jgi:phosphoglycolate phosphatase